MNLTLTICVGDGPNVGVKTQARDMTEREIRPALGRAQRALKAEIDAFERCPYHHPTDASKASGRDE